MYLKSKRQQVVVFADPVNCVAASCQYECWSSCITGCYDSCSDLCKDSCDAQNVLPII